eukprot:5862118-Pyramimonas_sp.AAC.1
MPLACAFPSARRAFSRGPRGLSPGPFPRSPRGASVGRVPRAQRPPAMLLDVIALCLMAPKTPPSPLFPLPLSSAAFRREVVRVGVGDFSYLLFFPRPRQVPIPFAGREGVAEAS